MTESVWLDYILPIAALPIVLWLHWRLLMWVIQDVPRDVYRELELMGVDLTKLSNDPDYKNAIIKLYWQGRLHWCEVCDLIHEENCEEWDD